MTVASPPGETLAVYDDNLLLLALCGTHDENLDRIERTLGIQIVRRGNRIVLAGSLERRLRAKAALDALYSGLASDSTVDFGDIDRVLNHQKDSPDMASEASDLLTITTRRRQVIPINARQADYIKALRTSEMVFGIGPAGTGKTYLAVAAAVAALLDGRVRRIILSRPAVEAGEHLGFLPGDMKEKIDPYMQPLFDALRDFLPLKTLNHHLEQQTIEIAPLAFMRGRTLSEAFVILDEAQNTTRLQMKMFLTRLGHGSRMVVNGDVSQIDLPGGQGSGLVDARSRLSGLGDIEFVTFCSSDVVRHGLVGRIINAYARKM
ncbi:MAG: PhoH family protein [Rhodobacteraceae bacterium]|nr:PhoH family protein [Paracoccaceae bacterium]